MRRRCWVDTVIVLSLALWGGSHLWRWAASMVQTQDTTSTPLVHLFTWTPCLCAWWGVLACWAASIALAAWAASIPRSCWPPSPQTPSPRREVGRDRR